MDVFEIAAIVEVLLALRHCDPRNVTADVAANLRRDVVSFVRHMPVHSRDRPGAPLLRYGMRTAQCGDSCAWAEDVGGCVAGMAAFNVGLPNTQLIYPDCAAIYKVVITRLHSWSDHMDRRVQRDLTLGRGRGRGAGAGGTKRPRGGAAAGGGDVRSYKGTLSWGADKAMPPSERQLRARRPQVRAACTPGMPDCRRTHAAQLQSVHCIPDWHARRTDSNSESVHEVHS